MNSRPEAPQATAPSGMLDALIGVDTRSLALFRILLALTLLRNLAGRARDLRAMYSDDGFMPIADVQRLLEGQWRWSLHFLNGSVEFQGLLFAVSAVIAVLLLVGWKSRLMSFLSWLLVTSLHTRAPILISGGDILLAMLLWWGTFMPLGARWSVDARRGGPSPARVLNVATAAAMIQVAFMYFATGISKCNAVWISGEALHHVMSFRMIARPSGQMLLELPGLLRVMTYGTLVLELAGPLLLFLPWRTQRLRGLALVGFVLLHIGIEITMQVIIFSWVSLAGLALFLPPGFWNRMAVMFRKGTRRRRSPEEVGGGRAAPLPRWQFVVCLAFACYVFLLNITIVAFGTPAVLNWPAPLRRPAETLVLTQYWNMFARPSVGDYRYALIANRFDGTQVELLRSEVWQGEEGPELLELSPTSASPRWMQVFIQLPLETFRPYRRMLAEYACREWNEAHPVHQHVESARLVVAFQKNPEGGEVETETMALAEPYARGTFEGGHRQGLWTFFYPNGRPRARGRYDQGFREGSWIWWNDDGRRTAEGHYRQGKKHGEWTYWYANGQKEGAGEYFEDEMHGRWIMYLEDGREVVVWYEHGELRPGEPTSDGTASEADAARSDESGRPLESPGRSSTLNTGPMRGPEPSRSG